MHALPVGIFKTRPGRQGNILEIREVGIEPVKYGARKALLFFHPIGPIIKTYAPGTPT